MPTPNLGRESAGCNFARQVRVGNRRKRAISSTQVFFSSSSFFLLSHRIKNEGVLKGQRRVSGVKLHISPRTVRWIEEIRPFRRYGNVKSRWKKSRSLWKTDVMTKSRLRPVVKICLLWCLRDNPLLAPGHLFFLIFLLSILSLFC